MFSESLTWHRPSEYLALGGFWGFQLPCRGMFELVCNWSEFNLDGHWQWLPARNWFRCRPQDRSGLYIDGIVLTQIDVVSGETIKAPSFVLGDGHLFIFYSHTQWSPSLFPPALCFSWHSLSHLLTPLPLPQGLQDPPGASGPFWL